MQVDFDIVGPDSASADLEILLLMRRCMRTLGMDSSSIHFAHRGVFNAFVAGLGLESRTVEVLRTIDKARKVGQEKTLQALGEIAGDHGAEKIMRFIRQEETWNISLEKLRALTGPENDGVKRLSEICSGLDELGLQDHFVLDPSITRGLDYYTGVVFETFLGNLPGIGSVCSGGRYNDLASLYTHQRLPGVGASIGVDRLMAAIEELGLGASVTSAPSLLVTCLEERLMGRYHRMAEIFREAGISAEVYPEQKRLAVQFSYAEKKGIRLAIVMGEKEEKGGVVALKDLRSRQSWEGLTLENAKGKARELLR